VVNNSRRWFLAPCLAMLTYGWTFHGGLFNYYLSAGLCLWALALFWQGTPARVAAGSVLMVLAYTAHAIGFWWAAGTIAYVGISRILPERFRPLLVLLGLGGVICLRLFITSRFGTFWSPHQVLEISAVDQVWTFGLKYCAISIGLGLLWSFLFLRLTHGLSFLQLVNCLPFQLCLIMSSGILLIPTRIELPGFQNAFFFITERMTLLLAVLICVLLGASKPSGWLTGSFLVLAAAYFSFLYVDTGALDAAEEKIVTAVNRLPAGQRVFTSFSGSTERIPLWPHAVDRACIGRCISYNNYEPYTAQFRIRAVEDTPFVIRSAEEHKALADGGYVVIDRDLPLYQIQICDAATGSLCANPMKLGDVTRSYRISLLPSLL
jgi:hypothetical protein